MNTSNLSSLRDWITALATATTTAVDYPPLPEEFVYLGLPTPGRPANRSHPLTYTLDSIWAPLSEYATGTNRTRRYACLQVDHHYFKNYFTP